MTRDDLEIIGGAIKETKSALQKEIAEVKTIKGDDGTDGQDGTDGTNGSNGFDGQDGSDGSNGLDGTNGQDGKDGDKGFDGTDGTDGANGIGIDLAVWEKGVYRKGVKVTHYMGQFYEATKDTSEEPSAESKHWKRIGNAGFRLTGGFKKNFEYQNGDFYIKDYSLFIYQNKEHSLLIPRTKALPPLPALPAQIGKDGKPGENATLEMVAKSLFDYYEKIDSPIAAFRGAYHVQTSYAKGDVVTMSGTLAFCKKSCKGKVPASSNDYWDVANLQSGGVVTAGGGVTHTVVDDDTITTDPTLAQCIASITKVPSFNWALLQKYPASTGHSITSGS